MENLHLSDETVARLREAGITATDELAAQTADWLLEHLDSEQTYEVAAALYSAGLGLKPSEGANYFKRANDRYLDMLRLRLIEGLTLPQIGERHGISGSTARIHLRKFWGLTGWRR